MTSLPITHIGSIPPTLGSRLFKLYNVLYVPSLKKNLLYASQFTKDNSTVVIIHPFGQANSDFNTGSPLFHGHYEGHLYLMSPCLPCRHFFLVALPS